MDFKKNRRQPLFAFLVPRPAFLGFLLTLFFFDFADLAIDTLFFLATDFPFVLFLRIPFFGATDLVFLEIREEFFFALFYSLFGHWR